MADSSVRERYAGLSSDQFTQPSGTVRVQFELSDDVGSCTVEREIDLSEAFEEGRLVFWSDKRGWDGIVCIGDEQYLYVNATPTGFAATSELSEEELAKRIESHITDQDAGRFGFFEKDCTPP